jgi:hypothetical protein
MATTKQIEAAAKSDATFDGRAWIGMPRWGRERYLERAKQALEAAERVADAEFAHTESATSHGA